MPTCKHTTAVAPQPCHNIAEACQLGLGGCGASLSSPGRLVLSELVGAGIRQMVNVRQDDVTVDCSVGHSHRCVSQRAVWLLCETQWGLWHNNWHVSPGAAVKGYLASKAGLCEAVCPSDRRHCQKQN